MNLSEVLIQPVGRSEEPRYQQLMQEHHYLGRLPKISETLWYVACWQDQWVALVSFSAAAWKCGARDRWIGWSSRHQYDRLKLVVNNSRFLILPDWHVPNLGSRFCPCAKRDSPAIGNTPSAIPCCCWRLLSTLDASGAPSTGPQTGSMWVKPEAFAGRAKATAKTLNIPKWSS